jgi:cell surface protein SprA
MFISYENTTINPNFDPANPDLRLEAALKSFNTDGEREAYQKLIRDQSIRRSLNFTNVRKVKTNKEAKTHIYDLKILHLPMRTAKQLKPTLILQENTRRNYKGAVAWQYSPRSKALNLSKRSKFLSSPFLELIKDFNFNPMPSNITIRGELDRSFNKMIYRNASQDLLSSIPNYQKYFVFNRAYNVRWSLVRHSRWITARR